MLSTEQRANFVLYRLSAPSRLVLELNMSYNWQNNAPTYQRSPHPNLLTRAKIEWLSFGRQKMQRVTFFLHPATRFRVMSSRGKIGLRFYKSQLPTSFQKGSGALRGTLLSSLPTPKVTAPVKQKPLDVRALFLSWALPPQPSVVLLDWLSLTETKNPFTTSEPAIQFPAESSPQMEPLFTKGNRTAMRQSASFLRQVDNYALVLTSPKAGDKQVEQLRRPPVDTELPDWQQALTLVSQLHTRLSPPSSEWMARWRRQTGLFQKTRSYASSLPQISLTSKHSFMPFTARVVGRWEESRQRALAEKKRALTEKKRVSVPKRNARLVLRKASVAKRSVERTTRSAAIGRKPNVQKSDEKGRESVLAQERLSWHQLTKESARVRPIVSVLSRRSALHFRDQLLYDGRNIQRAKRLLRRRRGLHRRRLRQGVRRWKKRTRRFFRKESQRWLRMAKQRHTQWVARYEQQIFRVWRSGPARVSWKIKRRRQPVVKRSKPKGPAPTLMDAFESVVPLRK
tara:strand:- start:13302 stop:14837 length:1536 start_codon:yes stop_codon:yes gene_type:complete